MRYEGLRVSILWRNILIITASDFIIGRSICIQIYFSGVDFSNVPFFEGSKDIGSLVVQPLSDDANLKQTLKERGQLFVALKGRHYKEYEGEIIQQDTKSSSGPPPTVYPPGMMGPMRQRRPLLRFQVYQFLRSVTNQRQLGES